MRATIVGAGVSGLTSAVLLGEAGWDVSVITTETYESTVSAVAAAVWTMTGAEPIESTRRWAIASRRWFSALADEGAAGVVSLRQRELERVDPGPTWWESTPHVRRLDPAELPTGYAAGFDVDGFMIEPPIYLAWLTSRVIEAGGTITRGTVEELEVLDGDVVVNCAGLGAGALVGDMGVYPIRGQVVAVPNPGIRDAVADESDPGRISYVYPRSREVILGGSRQVGATEPAEEPELTQRILADCARLDPRVAGLEPMAARVGLRPGRSAVRVEAEPLADGRLVVHNYGHGGAGFILSWGCAQDVTELASSGV